jgi:hypothetical protein
MVDDAQAPDALAGVLRGRQRRNHRVQQRQATVAPKPRRIVRRAIAFFVTIMSLSSSSETVRS